MPIGSGSLLRCLRKIRNRNLRRRLRFPIDSEPIPTRFRTDSYAIPSRFLLLSLAKLKAQVV